LGGVFGLFMSSLDFAGPSMNPDLHNQNSKVQLKIMAKDMAQRSWSTAKNFAIVGAVYSTTECIIESVILLFYFILFYLYAV
jgi:import inner membrane translocase subunit TIM22